jgi:NAD+ diphosphatase
VRPALSRSAIDRAAERRPGAAWLDDDTLRVLVIDEQGRALVEERDDGPHLLFTDRGADAPQFFLGIDADGATCAATVGELAPRIGARPLGLREVGALLGDRDAGLLTHAVALANWHATHTHCPRCGDRTEPDLGGHVRRCVRDRSEHFPRVDPAVIMLVQDGRDSCVLGRQPSWPARRFSTLAGFVEPGEAAELAVVREVAEEVGLHVTDVVFRASQPWPFPSSLMLGFRARAIDTDLVVDGSELAEARWFSRAELVRAVHREDVILPPPVSIAWQLITDWLAESPGNAGD